MAAHCTVAAPSIDIKWDVERGGWRAKHGVLVLRETAGVTGILFFFGGYECREAPRGVLFLTRTNLEGRRRRES